MKDPEFKKDFEDYIALSQLSDSLDTEKPSNLSVGGRKGVRLERYQKFKMIFDEPPKEGFNIYTAWKDVIPTDTPVYQKGRAKLMGDNKRGWVTFRLWWKGAPNPALTNVYSYGSGIIENNT